MNIRFNKVVITGTYHPSEAYTDWLPVTAEEEEYWLTLAGVNTGLKPETDHGSCTAPAPVPDAPPHLLPGTGMD